MKNALRALLFFVLPLVVFGLTSLQMPEGFVLVIALLLFLATLGLSFVKRESATFLLIKTVLTALIVLLLVGSTGWKLSPFFFLLYLMPIYLGFLYTAGTAFSFLAALIVIFSIPLLSPLESRGFEIMIIFSLLLAIPLVFYLRRKYLIIRQSTKDILILQDESAIKDADTIKSLLSNRITNLGVTIRQPLTFVRQASSLLLEEKLTAEQQQEYLRRMRNTATEALQHIRQFEGDTSANQVLTNKKVVSKPEEK